MKRISFKKARQLALENQLAGPMELQYSRSAFVVPPLLCFLFIIIATGKFACCNGENTPKAVVCREEEREALLSFKKGLDDPSDRLSSWVVGEDCCQNWRGVHCHNTTGHVLMLNLRRDIYQPASALGGVIGNSLLHLKHLRYLDLSCNYFGGIKVPEFLGSLSNLRYLNLSSAGFGGLIPYQLGNLSKLHYLDIKSSYPYPRYSYTYPKVESVEWISGLPLLEYLDMSHVNISSSKASNLLQVMNEHLHHLSVLRLSRCDLHPIHDPLPHVNFSSLLSLDLSYNYDLTSSSSFHWFAHLSSLTDLNLAGSEINGEIPSGIRNMSSLRFLDLSDNYFIASNIPDWLFHITTLEHLDLRSNKLEGKLPNEHIGNLTSITYLDLSYNFFDGEVPRSLGNLCRSQLSQFSYHRPPKSLEFLSLSGNNFSGPILDALIGECKSLQQLDLADNQFSGHLPNELGQLRSLSSLYIDGNSFSGEIPISLGQLSSLLYLDIRNNSFEGILSEKQLANLTSLQELDASSNHLLTVQISSDWTPPFQLRRLHLWSCTVGPSFPAWLQTQKSLGDLNMSYAGISDVIPDWFCTRSYDTVDLSHNQIMGSIPSLNSAYMYLGSNNFTGPPPQISSEVVELDLSNNKFSGSLSSMLCRRRTNKEEKNYLRNLDISGNLLSELPNCWMYWRELMILKLGNNNLMGHIPSSMASLIWLGSLHLRNNHLSGNFPLALRNCSSLVVLDLSENDFTGNIPAWMGNLKGKFIEDFDEKIYIPGLMVLVLHSNKFNGSIPLQLCQLQSLQILDLGNNNLSGTIPRCFGNFSRMIEPSNSTSPFPFYNENYYDFGGTDTATLITKGTEYEYQNNLGLLAGIDLSNNILSGGIPEELTGLHGLIFLNLSHNHLRGKIPVKIGAMTSLESLDLSMNTLSGVIPQGMATISFLSHLNLSYNNLSGKIPSGTQIQGFTPLSFIGNPKLCGAPLNHDCDEDGKPKAPTVSDDGNDDDDDTDDNGWLDIKWFYLGTPWGFVVGFWAILAPLAFKRDWRHAYFRFLDEMKYKLLGWFL